MTAANVLYDKRYMKHINHLRKQQESGKEKQIGNTSFETIIKVFSQTMYEEMNFRQKQQELKQKEAINDQMKPLP